MYLSIGPRLLPLGIWYCTVWSYWAQAIIIGCVLCLCAFKISSHMADAYTLSFIEIRGRTVQPGLSRFGLSKAKGKGRLLRFWSNSTATPDGSEQKPEVVNNVWHDSELVATKLCSQIGCKWNAMFESDVETGIGWTNFYFWFEYFFSSLPLKIIVICVTDQISITQSQRSVLNFKFASSNFSEVDELLGENKTKIVRREKIQLESMSNAIIHINKNFAVKNSGISCLALISWYSARAIWQWQSCM